MRQVLEDKITRLAEDEFMIEAIKELIAERIEKEKPVVDRDNDDKIIGQKYRAYDKAKEIMVGVLQDINSHLNNKKNSEEFNKGR